MLRGCGVALPCALLGQAGEEGVALLGAGCFLLTLGLCDSSIWKLQKELRPTLLMAVHSTPCPYIKRGAKKDRENR